jgi:hypothetical protein
MVALLTKVIEPFMVPSIVIPMLCKPTPLNWGQTRFPLISVGPLSVEQATVMVDADAIPVKATGAKANKTLKIERIESPPIE